MAIITLTTDFGLKDHFAGAVKGAILSEIETAQIIDISHQVSPFHITEAAYIIENAYQNFPKGSIHIIGIDSERNPENEHIALRLDGHFFVCANNGLMSLLSRKFVPEEIVQINIHDKVTTNFTVLDIFVKVACHIARGGTLGVIGKPIKEIREITNLMPVIYNEQKQIKGSVIYVDNYGNVITNIHRTLFESVGKGRPFLITARRATFTTVYDKYSDAINFDLDKDRREEAGKKLAIFNSGGYLELAIYKSNPNTVGGAASLFGLDYWDNVMVAFD